MSSLQDQLLKAGLVDKKKANKASKEKRKSQKLQNKSKQVVVDETKEAAATVRAEKFERDKQLNEQREMAAEVKAVAAQIKQLIAMNRQPKGEGADVVGYNFTEGKQIKKIYVAPLTQKQLANGRLAIVKLADEYELVPAVVADKISQRDVSVVLSRQVATSEPEEDDPYADYKIPDDLMW
ncbi:MAG: hypothetical protein ACI90U_003003 [Pseudomonadales bacterium]|jgi:uncharacterized protein YaiL (DUF2058 family)